MTRFIRHREGDLEPEDLKKVQNPALLIWGEEDRVVPVSIGKRLHDDLPDSILYSLRIRGTSYPKSARSLFRSGFLNLFNKNRRNRRFYGAGAAFFYGQKLLGYWQPSIGSFCSNEASKIS